MIYTAKTKLRMPKCVPYKNVSMDGIINTLQAASLPTITENSGEADVELAVAQGCRVIMEAVARAATQP